MLQRFMHYLQLLVVNAIKSGPVPKHVAMIMDGNRRWAKAIDKSELHGHSVGYNRTLEMMDACIECGCKKFSLFMLATANLKRSEKEKTNFFYLITDLFRNLLDKPRLVMERGIKVQWNGDPSLLPTECKNNLARLVLLTKDNDNFIFEAGLATSGLTEMTHAVNNIKNGVQDGLISVKDIDEKLIYGSTFTGSFENVDLLIRTSGECRLSDYLSWHMRHAVLKFYDILWPEISKWHVYDAILTYQQTFSQQMQVKKDLETMTEEDCKNSDPFRVQNYFTQLEEKRWKAVEKYSKEFFIKTPEYLQTKPFIL